MKKLRLIGVVTLVLLMQLSAMSLRVYAAEPTMEDETVMPPPSSIASAGDTSSDSQGRVEVVSYEIMDKDGVKNITTVNADDTVVIRVHIMDTRSTLTVDALPSATLNTSSFRLAGSVTSENHAVGSYTIVFPCTYVGTGNSLGFDLFYANNPNALVMQHVSITLNQCIERTPPASEPSIVPESPVQEEEEPIVRGTGFILKSMSYGDGKILAGDEFTIDAVLMATNGDVSIDNVAVSAILPKELELADNSGVVYVGSVHPNQEIPVSFILLSSSAIEQGSYSVTLNIIGARNDDGTEIRTSVGLSIPIKQPERFEVGNVSLPTLLNIAQDNGAGFSSISLVNKGKGIIYNVTVTLQGDYLSMEETSVFLGNIDPGTQSVADFNIKVREEGTHTGTILISYENEQGEAKIIKHPFSVNAEAKVNTFVNAPAPATDTEETTEGIPTWIWGLIVAIALGSVAVVNKIYKHRKAEKYLTIEESFADDVV